MTHRPSWDEYFMAICDQVGGRSTCLRRNVGAIVVLDRRILATGYNGPPSGLPHCDQVGCLREQRGIESGSNHELCRGIHAEQNAVIQAAKYGIAIQGAMLYTSHQPCVLCAKILINAGVREIVYGNAYPDELARSMLADAGVVEREFAGAPAPAGDSEEAPA